MLTLFQERQPIDEGLKHHLTLSYYMERYRLQITEIQNYWSSFKARVDSAHPLCRFINNTVAPLEYSDEQYMNVIGVRSDYTAMNLGWSSSMSYGRPTQGLWYAGCEEYTIAHAEYFDRSVEWTSLRPVKVLLHPFNDLNLGIPYKLQGATTGIVVLSINTDMLMWMYREFKKANESLDYGFFVRMHVLPNMLESSFDVAVMNRLMDKFYGVPTASYQRLHSVGVADYSKNLSSILVSLNKVLSDNRWYYSTALKYLPSLSEKDMLASLKLPDVTPTRQIQWLLMLSRLTIMKYLIDVGGRRTVNKNQMYVNDLKWDLRRFLNNNGLLPYIRDVDIRYDTKLKIEELFYV